MVSHGKSHIADYKENMKKANELMEKQAKKINELEEQIKKLENNIRIKLLRNVQKAL